MFTVVNVIIKRELPDLCKLFFFNLCLGFTVVIVIIYTLNCNKDLKLAQIILVIESCSQPI